MYFFTNEVGLQIPHTSIFLCSCIKNLHSSFFLLSLKQKFDIKMIDINKLRKLNTLKNIVVTEHARIRLNSRNISIYDVQRVINEGEIIRQYEEDKPFASCLILGLSVGNVALHVVVSHDEEFIYLITAYYPSPTIWELDFKTKKS